MAPSSRQPCLLFPLRARVTAWLADAANGIGEVFARVFRAKDALCINDTCVNEDQLKTLLGSAAAGSSSSGGAPETTGGASANEIPDADDGTVPDNDDDAAAVATSTLEIGTPVNDNQLAADAGAVGGPSTASATSSAPAAHSGADNETNTSSASSDPAGDNASATNAQSADEPPVSVPANDNPPPAEQLSATATE